MPRRTKVEDRLRTAVSNERWLMDATVDGLREALRLMRDRIAEAEKRPQTDYNRGIAQGIREALNDLVTRLPMGVRLRCELGR